jgi:hypothetical protein
MEGAGYVQAKRMSNIHMWFSFPGKRKWRKEFLSNVKEEFAYLKVLSGSNEVIVIDLRGRHVDKVKYRCLIRQKPSSAEVRNEWSSKSIPNICLHGVDRGNFRSPLIR